MRGRYRIEKSYFRGSPRYGRTTTITDTITGKKGVFMGIVDTQRMARAAMGGDEARDIGDRGLPRERRRGKR